MITHLVDASVLKRLAHPAVAEVLVPLAGRLGRARITDLEIGYSARNAAEWDLLAAQLGGLERIGTASEHVERALEVQRLLAGRSQRGRKIPDLLVAAAAEANGLTVLHYDADFDLIAEVTGQPAQWVAPAGSVD